MAKCFKEILIRAAESANRMYAVSESMLDKNPCIGKSIRMLEPPSNWINWENFNLYQNKAVFFNVRNFKQQEVPADILNGEQPLEQYVSTYVQHVQRLRGWKKHLQFGIVYTTNASVCRLDLGLGRGLTSWIPLYQMAIYLSDHECLQEARTHHEIGKKRKLSRRDDYHDDLDDDDVNYTIGPPGLYDSSSE